MNTLASIKKLMALNAEKEALRQTMMQSIQAHAEQTTRGIYYQFCIHDHYNPLQITAVVGLFADSNAARFTVNADAGSVALTQPGDYGNADTLMMLDIIVSWLAAEPNPNQPASAAPSAGMEHP